MIQIQRVTHIFAVLSVVAALGMVGCGSSDDGAVVAPPTATATPPTGATAPTPPVKSLSERQRLSALRRQLRSLDRCVDQAGDSLTKLNRCREIANKPTQ